MNFIHIGAGAGDQDPSCNFRDGFSEYVKNHKSKIKKIFVVEVNPKNIKKLKKTWKNYKHTKIFNYAITPNNFNKKKIKLFYSEKDAPHYQLLSNDINHVKRYYPKSKIKFLIAKPVKIKSFLEKNFKNLTIESLSIDVEGADYDIIADINLKKFNIKNISIEYLHLDKVKKKNIINNFIKNGYSYNGFGIDHNNIDWLFTKKKSLWNNLISKILPYLHRIHYKRLNILIKNL
ncbi:FkbM family methyltransferase [Pelagibacteraceae bacterium]|jgi:FkbM family methyltransferase|nr:FkbM family methyltransferase [Pelagibacteraceae bacterium]